MFGSSLDDFSGASCCEAFALVFLLEGFEFLKKALEEGYFEDLIRKYLLDNTHGAILSLVPEKGLAAKRDKELEEKLENYRKSLSDEELTRMVENTKALEAYQESEEDPEALTCIPMLSREDIKKEITGFTNEEHFVDDSLFLYHDVRTNGIGYADLLFEIHNFDTDTVHYLGLLKSVLGYVDTENYTYGELFNEINANTGGINCGVEVFDRADSTEEFQAMFSVRGKALYTKMDFLFKMIGEILNSSKLEDTKRLYEIVASVKSRAQVNLTGAGHSTAVLRAAAYSSPMAAFQDEMAGIGYYQFIEKFFHHRIVSSKLRQLHFFQTMALFDHAVIIVFHTVVQRNAFEFFTVIKCISSKRFHRLWNTYTL